MRKAEEIKTKIVITLYGVIKRDDTTGISLSIMTSRGEAEQSARDRGERWRVAEVTIR